MPLVGKFYHMAIFLWPSNPSYIAPHTASSILWKCKTVAFIINQLLISYTYIIGLLQPSHSLYHFNSWEKIHAAYLFMWHKWPCSASNLHKYNQSSIYNHPVLYAMNRTCREGHYLPRKKTSYTNIRKIDWANCPLYADSVDLDSKYFGSADFEEATSQRLIRIVIHVYMSRVL